MVLVPVKVEGAKVSAVIAPDSGAGVVCSKPDEACEGCSSDCRAWRQALDASLEEVVVAEAADQAGPSYDQVGLVVAAVHRDHRHTSKMVAIAFYLGMPGAGCQERVGYAQDNGRPQFVL